MVSNKGKDKAFNIVIAVLMVLFGIIILLPLLHVLASSFSSPSAVYTGRVLLFPVEFSLESYSRVFAEESIWLGFRNSFFYTVFGTVITLFLQMTAGYALSRKDLRFRSFFMFLFILTIFIGGGLVPSYIIVMRLKLLDTMWAIILPGALSAYNVIIVRTFVTTSIPWEVQESAMMDGCNALKLFAKFIVPLSKPMIVVMALYAIVGYWNSYFNALIYVTDASKHPLQMVLRKILVTNSTSVGGDIGGAEAVLLSESLKYSTIIISSVPVLLLYPFFERHFEKGMIIGSLKG
jgi:putative aldouronate transport system permease protein